MKKVLRKIIALVVMAVGIFPTARPPWTIAVAEDISSTLYYESTNVLDDLTNATIDGKPFSLTEYNFDERKETQLLVLSEYCYSFYKDKQESYGLYAYVYNPKGLLYEENSEVNRIQMSVGEGNGYTKYALTY